jgi:hypothetical protein
MVSKVFDGLTGTFQSIGSDLTGLLGGQVSISLHAELKMTGNRRDGYSMSQSRILRALRS